MQGIGPVNLTQKSGGSSSSGAGSIAFGVLSEAIANSPINLSTEGTRDWFAYVAQGAFGDWTTDTPAGIHAKLLGGYVRRSFKFFGPSGTYTAANGTTSKWLVSSTLGDDSCLGQVRLLNFLNANQGIVILNSNNSLAPGYSNWGFALSALAGKTSRTINLYFAFAIGVASNGNTLQFTARLSDGSAGDISTSINNGVTTGLRYYQLPITFKAGSEGVPLWISANVIQIAADTGTQVGFQAATLF